MRDVLAKEIGLYVHHRKLDMPPFPLLIDTRRPAKASIGRLSEGKQLVLSLSLVF
jgi:hypothetical protein